MTARTRVLRRPRRQINGRCRSSGSTRTATGSTTRWRSRTRGSSPTCARASGATRRATSSRRAWIPVEVADAPFVVIRFERSDDGFRVVLNDGTQERVEPATLRIGLGDIPYCAVKGGTFEARFSRAAAYQLLGMAEYDERTGRGVLRHGARGYEL